MSETASPCRAICALDGSGRFCTGCGRTLAEIAGWATASEAEKKAIIAKLPERLSQAGR